MSLSQRDIHEVLNEFTGARVRRSTAQPVTHNVTETITFDTVTYDTGGYWSASAPTRLTVSVPGLYSLVAGIEWAAHATGIRQVGIAVNGSAIAVDRRPNHGGVLPVRMGDPATKWRAVAGDYFTLTVYQDSGGPLDVNAQNPWSPYLAINFEGP